MVCRSIALLTVVDHYRHQWTKHGIRQPPLGTARPKATEPTVSFLMFCMHSSFLQFCFEELAHMTGLGCILILINSMLWDTGGACGYGPLVDVRPFRARVGAVSDVLFKGGEGCGACYKVKCSDHSICSRRPATIIVIDQCPGGYCAFGRTHFDLSGGAFGHMAISGEANNLRNRGEIPVLFRR